MRYKPEGIYEFMGFDYLRKLIQRIYVETQVQQDKEGQSSSEENPQEIEVHLRKNPTKV